MYALSDEWHQHFVAGRHGSVFDTVIDLLGIALGLAIVAWWVWWMTTIKDVTAGK
jgi:VanZ family protein